MSEKPIGWDNMLNDLINGNKNYEDTNAALKKQFGDEGTLSGVAYRERKTKLTGGAEVDEKIEGLRERKQVKKEKKSKPAWSKQKQTAADTSKLAQIINMGLYQGIFPFCANKELKQEHIQEINPGGAVVATITYYFPEAKLEHPLITLGIRAVILYIKFKAVCGKINKTTGKVLTLGKSNEGLKSGMKTERRG